MKPVMSSGNVFCECALRSSGVNNNKTGDLVKTQRDSFVEF